MTSFSKRTKKREAIFLDGLRRGFSVSLAASAAGVGRSTVYDWRLDCSIFAEQWDDAKEEGTDLLEDEAWRRAVTGIDKHVGFYQGVSNVTVKEYSDTLLILLLKSRRRSKFGDKLETDSEASVSVNLNEEDRVILERAGIRLS